MTIRNPFAWVIWGILTVGSSGATTIQLDDLRKAALEANPDFLRAQAMLMKGRADRAENFFLAAPQLSVSWMGPDQAWKSRDGDASKPSFAISQKLPFPNVWWKRNQSYNRSVEIAQEQERLAQDQAVNTLEELFWSYYANIQGIELLSEERDLLLRHKKNATYRPIQNELMKAHLFQVDEELGVLNAQTQSSKLEALGVLMKIRELSAFPKDVPSMQKLPAVELPPLGRSDFLERLKVERHPQYRARLAEIHKKEAELSLERHRYMPELNVAYVFNSKDTPMPNSRQLSLGVSLPFVYFWQQNSRISQKQADLKVAEITHEAVLRDLEDNLSLQKEKLSTLRSLIKAYQGEIIPVSEKRVQYLYRIAAGDMEALTQRFQAAKDLLKHKRKLLSLRAQFEASLANLKLYLENGDKSL